MSEKDPKSIIGTALALLVFDAVMETHHQPLQLRDFERYLFSGITGALAAGELKPSLFLSYDPPNLLGEIQALRHADLLERVPQGYVITAAGRTQADAWEKDFQPATIEGLRKGIAVAA